MISEGGSPEAVKPGAGCEPLDLSAFGQGERERKLRRQPALWRESHDLPSVDGRNLPTGLPSCTPPRGIGPAPQARSRPVLEALEPWLRAKLRVMRCTASG
jgi:hypothetical protein